MSFPAVAQPLLTIDKMRQTLQQWPDQFGGPRADGQHQRCRHVGQQKTSPDTAFVRIKCDDAAVTHLILGNGATGGEPGVGRTIGQWGSNGGAFRPSTQLDSISETSLIRSTKFRYLSESRNMR